MIKFWDEELKKKIILGCGIFLIIFPFIPCWFNSEFNTFWIPIIGMFVGHQLITTNFLFYGFAAFVTFGGMLCCFMKKNIKLVNLGALIAIISAFLLTFFHFYNTIDFSNIQSIIDTLFSIQLFFQNFEQFNAYVIILYSLKLSMILNLLQGNVLLLEQASEFYFGYVPIIIGILVVFLNENQ